MPINSKPIDPLTEIDNLAARVLRDGWFKSTVTEMGYDLHSAPETIATMLGNPVRGRAGQKIESLSPTVQAGANSKSLSAMHGLGSFPMHTDGAHLLQPPRFVVLVCASPGEPPVPTTLVKFAELRIGAS